MLPNAEGENFIKRFCVTGTNRFQPHFCENSGLLGGINWWSVSHLVEEHFYHHFWGFDNFFEGGTVPLTTHQSTPVGNAPAPTFNCLQVQPTCISTVCVVRKEEYMFPVPEDPG